MRFAFALVLAALAIGCGDAELRASGGAGGAPSRGGQGGAPSTGGTGGAGGTSGASGTGGAGGTSGAGGAAVSGAGIEQRCVELGADCTCSETLNTNLHTHNGNGNSGPDFADGSDTKECQVAPWFDRGGQGGSGAQPLKVAETGMPIGNQVAYVWRSNVGHGAVELRGTPTIRATTKRLCYRHYLRFSDNFLDHGCDGGKYAQFQWSTAYDLQMGSGGGAGLTWWAHFGSTSSTNMPATGDLHYSDCVEPQWCRIEICVSGDFAGGTGDFFAEAHARRISDGKSKDWARFDLGAGSPGLSLNGKHAISNAFRGDDELTCHPSSNRPDPGSWREASYGMQAEWTTDEGQLIGCAQEVEGPGCR